MEEILQIIKINYKDNYLKIDLDNGESLKIPILLSNSLNLSVDRGIDKIEYLHLKEESERFNCKEKALTYLSVKDRSKFEIESYLRKKGFSQNIIKEVIAQVTEAGYIDDYSYAVKYAKELKRKKPVGINIIRNKLNSKGISRDKIKKALKESGAYETDIEKVFELALKKYYSYKDKKNYQSRLYFFLTQRGFEKDTIDKVIALISDKISSELNNH